MESATTLLGEALSLTQLGMMVGTALVCLVLQQALLRFSLTIRKLPPQSREAIPIYIVALVHSCVVVALALWTLLAPEETISKDPFYGHSVRVQLSFAIAAGYFLFEFFTVCFVEGQFDLGFLLHATVCFLVYVFAQRPFLPWMGCVCLLWEFSTPFLNAGYIVAAIWPDEQRTIQVLRALFAVTFIVVRLLVGIPLSILWFVAMGTRIANGSLHSIPVVVFYLCANLILNALNLFWGYKIVRRMLKMLNVLWTKVNTTMQHSVGGKTA